MSNNLFSVNIDADQVLNQYQEEQKPIAKKTTFDTKNYLQARLMPNENHKVLTIRLLPFSPQGGTPFKKVHMHTVKVNKELSPSGWKTFVCPINNVKDGMLMGDKCPFCETSKKARQLKDAAVDEGSKKKYSEIEFLNKVKEMWIVRCIERDHEEDGVKFWLFNSSKKKNGVFDQIMNIASIRAEMAARKGNKYSIFDLTNGLDLVVTLTRTSDNKTAVQIMDTGIPSPLSEDQAQGEAWIKDEKKWDEVYTVKTYEFMSIVASGGVPYYDKEKHQYVDKASQSMLQEAVEQEKSALGYAQPTRDFSVITTQQGPQSQTAMSSVASTVNTDVTAYGTASPKSDITLNDLGF